jgi:indolepyruvate ferredoxin oxidoreductase, alpha subunit
MKGREMLATALLRSADRFYTVPGYPVSEIGAMLGAAVTVNEKVALEYALGDSLAGRRAVVVVKSVGLNACADPLVNATTQGLRAGVVVLVGDDVEAIASQNAQDSRYYGEVAEIPVLEPDEDTISGAVEAAFEASEAFSRVAMVRVTPALLDAEVPEFLCTRHDLAGSLADPGLTLRGRVTAADRRLASMFDWSRSSPLNRLIGGQARAGPGPEPSRIVTVYPPPAGPAPSTHIREIGRPFLQEHRSIAPPDTQKEPETMRSRGYYRIFCPGCPFRSVFSILRENGTRVICDAGCSILATNPPYAVGIASYGLGSSVAVAATSTGVAVIGDYALLHSGINALIDVYEKQAPLLCIVLKNNRMGMTGGHSVPDILRYIAWADPLVCDAGDEERLRCLLGAEERPRTVVVEGICPEGGRHETVEY